MSRRLIPILVVLGAAALYLPHLQNAPLYASHDEIIYSLQAHALATTGRDLSGSFLPMFIEYPAEFGRPTWNTPLLIYAIAATLKVLPFSEFAIRLPMVIFAILDVLLLYFVARIMFEAEWFAVAAAALLAVTPAHFMHSRQAIDFQLSLPFILGWLLCVAHYIRRGGPRMLFAAGVLLGLSLLGYVAAYVLVPLLAFATIVVLWRRRDPFVRHTLFVVGILAPLVLTLPWLLRSPLPFRDVAAHYFVLSGSPSSQSSLFDLVRDFASSSRVREIPALYASFFDPQFLFINGPLRLRATQLVGVFLVGLAGALVVGLVCSVRRRSPEDLLLLAGLLTGPLVSSLGGEAQTIWRTLQLAPFGVLLAVAGLRSMSAVDTRSSRLAIVTIFATAIALASWYHDFLPHAQALVRAASVPLAVTGLAVLAQPLAGERLSIVRAGLVSAAVLLSMHIVFFVADQATTTGVLLMVGLALATVLARAPERFSRDPLFTVALLAFVTGQFMYLYVDYGQIRRVGPIPASALVLALRLAFSSIALAAVFVVARIVARPSTLREPQGRPEQGRRTTRSGRADSEHARGEPVDSSLILSSSKDERLAQDVLVGPRALVAFLLVTTQLAYYGIDLFTDFRLRAVHVAVVVIAVVGLAALVRSLRPARVTFGHIAIAGVFGLTSIQFTTFYIDYVTEFQARGSAEVEGNMKGAFESVIERTRERSAPTIYLGRLGPYFYGELFWKFYLIKHHREDLLSLTVADGEFKPDRVRALPPGSLVITSPTRQIDSEIDQLAASGVLKDRQLLKAPDGAPIFWILETAEAR